MRWTNYLALFGGINGVMQEHGLVEHRRVSFSAPQDILQKVISQDRTVLPVAFYKARSVEFCELGYNYPGGLR